MATRHPFIERGLLSWDIAFGVTWLREGAYNGCPHFGQLFASEEIDEPHVRHFIN